MWGQEYLVNLPSECLRIIPTRVGTSVISCIISVKYRDHPHACGDKIVSSAKDPYYPGSSPRVWGQVVIVCRVVKPSRIIPTRVGTSAYYRADISIIWDHPHACGDKLCRSSLCGVLRGSSPRVWGQGYSVLMNIQEPRIIPTRVGTRSTLLSLYSIVKDHPHACGDKVDRVSCDRQREGSSPRVWGQVYVAIDKSTTGGIIPTRVGTSAYLSRGKHRHKDHPHACGDKYHRKILHRC